MEVKSAVCYQLFVSFSFFVTDYNYSRCQFIIKYVYAHDKANKFIDFRGNGKAGW